MPPATITSASPTFAQVTPTAPHLICRWASRGDLCALLCGLQSRPFSVSTREMDVAFRWNASRSRSGTGVST